MIACEPANPLKDAPATSSVAAPQISHRLAALADAARERDDLRERIRKLNHTLQNDAHWYNKRENASRARELDALQQGLGLQRHILDLQAQLQRWGLSSEAVPAPDIGGPDSGAAPTPPTPIQGARSPGLDPSISDRARPRPRPLTALHSPDLRAGRAPGPCQEHYGHRRFRATFSPAHSAPGSVSLHPANQAGLPGLPTLPPPPPSPFLSERPPATTLCSANG